MIISATSVQIVTLILIFLELVIFIFKFCFYLFKPDEYNRLWFLILLLLLILYNTASGFFPDPKISLSLIVQNILKYGSGFLTATYFPYYFYKTYQLHSLRFHAWYGAPLGLLLPYVIFFVLIYPVNHDLGFAVRYGLIIPFVYGTVLLVVIPKAILLVYKESGNREEYLKSVAVFAGLSPWFLLIILDYYHASHLLELLLANLGIIVITIILLWKSINRMRQENREITSQGFRTEIFESNCRLYKLTRREIEIALLLREGLTYRQIALKLFISLKTADNHIQSIYAKTRTNNKVALIDKMYR